VELPAGASILSAAVAGEPVKPADGKDGTRVPLLRSGFRPDGLYVVSFVYLHPGTPFLKKGERLMTLPRMDVPVNIVEWELFVPDRYRADRFEGNAIAADVAIESAGAGGGAVGYGSGPGSGRRAAELVATDAFFARAVAGQILGRVMDSSGRAIPGVSVTATVSGTSQSAITDSNGSYVLSGVPSGRVIVTGQLEGFGSSRSSFEFDQRPRQADLVMQVGTITETVTVTAAAPIIDVKSSTTGVVIREDESRPRSASNQAAQAQAPSANVQNLQRLAAGVLPVRIDVPRAGTSHRFVKPLVIDEETSVSFRYRRR
jgi:hypothetical protein